MVTAKLKLDEGRWNRISGLCLQPYSNIKNVTNSVTHYHFFPVLIFSQGDTMLGPFPTARKISN